MKISVITASYNSAATITDTLRSVNVQTHPDVEHIIVDGASADGTLGIIDEHRQPWRRVVSEPDKGIYDAMNKGLFLATGDVVAFLNSDDRYADASVLSDVATAFETMGCDYVYGDIQMVNEAGQLVRDWKTGTVPPEGLTSSQIPHPALFVRRPILVGITPPFDTSYRISADLKQQLIFVNKLRAKGAYVHRPLAVMRMGGASTGGLSSYVAGWRESTRAFNEVHGKGGFWYTLKKVASKFRGVRLLS